MRYARADRLIQLALEMQAARGGLTLTDIETRFEVSRRTAIRMRDAVLRVFPQADEVPSNDRSKRWRLSTPATRPLLGITADDLATIEVAAARMAADNLVEAADDTGTPAADACSLTVQFTERAATVLQHGGCNGARLEGTYLRDLSDLPSNHESSVD